MFSANDDLVAMTFFWHGESSYEPMSMQLWKQAASEAKCVLDVGAFSGVYSLLAAKTNQTASILSVEASRRTYGRLLMNIYSNQLEGRIKPICIAASNTSGSQTFKRFRGLNILGIGDSFLDKRGLEAQSVDEIVSTVSLDQLSAEAGVVPDLIKIDVEGAECLVLDGMSRLIQDHTPKMLIEVTPDTSAEVCTRLEVCGYQLFIVDEKSMTLRAPDGQVREVCNLLAIPKT